MLPYEKSRQTNVHKDMYWNDSSTLDFSFALKKTIVYLLIGTTTCILYLIEQLKNSRTTC